MLPLRYRTLAVSQSAFNYSAMQFGHPSYTNSRILAPRRGVPSRIAQCLRYPCRFVGAGRMPRWYGDSAVALNAPAPRKRSVFSAHSKRSLFGRFLSRQIPHQSSLSESSVYLQTWLLPHKGILLRILASKDPEISQFLEYSSPEVILIFAFSLL